MKIAAGKTLKMCRIKLGMKQQDVAAKLGSYSGRLVQIENTDKPIELDWVKRYAKVLGIPVEVPILLSIDADSIHEVFRSKFKELQIIAYDYMFQLEKGGK